MGKFIWNKSGRILRIALDEIKNKKLDGGLQLPCLASMADSLRLSQCVRLINSGDKKSLQHLSYWLGDLLDTLIPGLGQVNSAVVIPDFFELSKAQLELGLDFTLFGLNTLCSVNCVLNI